jgi:hypothetical protein
MASSSAWSARQPVGDNHAELNTITVHKMHTFFIEFTSLLKVVCSDA